MNRDEQNKILKSHDYRWEKITQDWLDDNDDFETRPGWHLYAPGGREVSVERALREIEIGVDAVEREERTRANREFIVDSIKRELRGELDKQISYIQQWGERPVDVQPSGERILDTQNIYGGGDWFVIEDGYIWYCQNNGMDGDNWSHNNVRTGGAGAIGWRIERMQPQDDMVDFLRKYADGSLLQWKMEREGVA